jgi:hypothetical protein
MDEAGRILFNPPHNLFQLKDSTNPTASQWVRLVGLEPPPPDYTFDKQAHDTPDIRLLVEYLDPQTHQAIARQSYPFPGCMYEGGKLDRYRWEVSTIPLPPPDKGLPPVPAPALASAIEVKPVEPLPEPVSIAPTRRVLELPVTKALTFPLANPADSEAVLKRMRLWAAWSEKAMPQSRWEMIQDGAGYTLMNAHFKRRILKFSSTQATITLENSLPVIAKWFHDLGLAVSQAQNQRQYSAVQLKLAHSLFIDMSLPQTDPVVMLRKLFGVEFSRP